MTVRHMSYASLSGQKMFRMYYIGGRPACMGGAWGYPYVAISPLQAQCSAHGGAYAWGVEVVGGSVDGGWRHGGLCLVGRGRVPLGGRREPCVAHDVVLLLVSRATSAPRDAPRFQGSSRTAFGRLAFLGLGRGRGHKGGGGNGDGAVRRVLALGGKRRHERADPRRGQRAEQCGARCRSHPPRRIDADPNGCTPTPLRRAGRESVDV